MPPFDASWFLLALPLAFGLGWLGSRLDLRQLRREDRESPRAYFKGLNFLLNEQHDKAIDAFIEAVQSDPDTAELHFALGNLFRRRGEFERAVRVHEHLLARADLSADDRARARQALAQDFMRAGLFDRAEAAWQQLEGTAYDAEARLALLSLHERSRDWPAALAQAGQLEQRGTGSFSQRIAHYHCEQALQADSRGDEVQALAELDQARAAAPQAARPLLQAGAWHFAHAQPERAIERWDELLRVQPLAFNLVAADYARAAQACGRQPEAMRQLSQAYDHAPSVALLKAQLSLGAQPPDAAAAAWARHLQQAPGLAAAQALLALPPTAWADGNSLAAARSTVQHLARPAQRYRCAACGFESHHWFWQCPGCLSWDSFPPLPVEEL